MSPGLARSLPLVMAVLILAGCSLPPEVAIATPTPAAQRSADPAAMAAREAAHPDPNFDFGYTVQITPDGIHPVWLVAACCGAVTWKNLTNGPVTVVFDHQAVNSGTIPPGRSFVWKPQTIQSITYHLGENPSLQGALQINQTFESMLFTDS